ncbi:MAG: DUF983 domain-containing protein [Opitutales bacterium]
MGPGRITILARGAMGQCPCCRSKDLFLSRFRLRSRCPGCGLPIENEDGWSLGAIPLNYAITGIFWILPAGIAFLLGWISLKVSLLLAGLGAFILPLITYRFSKTLWLGLYYMVLPHELSPSRDDKKRGA